MARKRKANVKRVSRCIPAPWGLKVNVKAGRRPKGGELAMSSRIKAKQTLPLIFF